jgi:peptidoglycan-associated lipoprotein
MARNPSWCGSVRYWRQLFADWIDRGDPQALLHASVFFDFDDSRMKQADLSVIERYGRYLTAVRGASARIEGHADERGSREYNLALGQRRAQSVVDALKVLGVADSRVEAVSYGEERPRAPGSDEASWAQNRRADLSVKR